MKCTVGRIFLVLLGLAALGRHAAAQDLTEVGEIVKIEFTGPEFRADHGNMGPNETRWPFTKSPG